MQPQVDVTDYEKSAASSYMKLSPRDHMLLRPDTYIGSTEPNEAPLWQLNAEGTAIERRLETYSPGFLKIFDEVLVNAMDQQFAKKRTRKQTQVTEIAISVDVNSGTITVSNDGPGIPVEMHAEYQQWVPSFIFGELMTGSNFDDAAGPRYVGGRNGVGAKAANVFSKHFRVEVVDTTSGKRFVQEWRDNMASPSPPKISKVVGATTGQVTVQFTPDFARFGMQGIDESTLALLRSRVVEAAACTKKGIRIIFNGEEVAVGSFKDYAQLVFGGSKHATFEVKDDSKNVRLEIAAGVSTLGEFQSIGFVNGIRCHEGTHIDYISSQLASETVAQIKKSSRTKQPLDIKPLYVRQHLQLVVKVLVENPAFESQSKGRLQTPVSKYGFDVKLPPFFVKKVVSAGLAKLVQSYAMFKRDAGSVKQLERKLAGSHLPPKLEDAANAGVEGHNCTLILTEGDSAKAMALGALEQVPGGRVNYGIFPLKGKIMNVRDVSIRTLSNSSCVQELMQVIGLRLNEDYVSVAAPNLRYQRIMVFADQDHDGDHITGLIINFFSSLWPSLFEAEPRFIVKFGTPLVKVQNYPRVEFFSMQEWEEWAAAQTGKRPIPKYYKGLGTSTDSEAMVYFSNLSRHTVTFEWSGSEDDKSLELAFDKRKTDGRKDWLLETYDASAYLDYSRSEASYKEFFDKSFIHFSMYDCQRSIPHLMDGMKPSQRKAIWIALRRLKSEMKVTVFANIVMQETKYHHGEQAMMEAIVRLAQTHVGTNNVNFLVPRGQFGSRLHDRSEHAQFRYIGTQLEDITRKIFRPEDDAILEYLVDESAEVEPRFLAPVAPTLLLNGASGIGTGWATEVACYNPVEVIQAVRNVLAGDTEPQVLTPWFHGFDGEVYRTGAGKLMSAGTWRAGWSSKSGELDTIEITELPVGTWTDSYKEWLHQKQSKLGFLRKIDSSRNGKSSVNLVLRCDPAKLRDFLKKNAAGDKIGKALGLVQSVHSNMWLWNTSSKLEFYQDTDSVIRAFHKERLQLYKTRRAHMIQMAEKQLLRTKHKHQFVRSVVDGTLKLCPPPARCDLEAELARLGLEPLPAYDARGRNTTGPSYDYLLDMKFHALTRERVEELEANLRAQEEQLRALRRRTAEDSWRQDLDELEDAYAAFLAQRQKLRSARPRVGTVLVEIAAQSGDRGTTIGLEGRVIRRSKKRRAAAEKLQV